MVAIRLRQDDAPIRERKGRSAIKPYDGSALHTGERRYNP